MLLAIYSIQFAVTSDSGATRTITASVVAGDSPIIDGPTFTELAVGTSFDPMTGITATDSEDGNITGIITHTGTVDNNVPGVYTLVYSVTDSDSNTLTKTRVVLVNDGTFSVGTTYILKASNFTKRVGQVDTSDGAIKGTAGVKVYYKGTGALTAEPVTINSKGGYTNVVGNYSIKFSVTSDGAATRTITGTVIIGGLPTINGPTFTEIAAGTPFDPMAGITATDSEDGNITGIITHTGTVDNNVPGVYTLVYSVTDSDSNTLTKTRVVLVNDGNFSVGTTYILKASNFTKRVGQVDTSDGAIKGTAGVKVYYKGTGALTAEPVTINSKGGYTNVAGNYSIQFAVTSDSGATRTITASVVAGDSPIIDGPTFTELAVGTSFDPMTGITATDSEDGNITGIITHTGTVDNNVPGVYTLVYSVTDSDSNTLTKDESGFS